MRAKAFRRSGGLLRQIFFQLIAGLALMATSMSIEAASAAETEFTKYEWEGTWDLAYKKELTGPTFAWAFTRIGEKFHARFAFSVAANGTVKGAAYANLNYRSEYEGCAIVSKNLCVVRCKGGAVVETVVACMQKWPETTPCSRGPLPFFVTDILPVTGQVNGQTVHLKLGPPADLVDVRFSSTCVGPNGTVTNNPKITYFCADLTQPCSASGHFLEIDMPLVHQARQPIHTTEVGGGADGVVEIRHTCGNVSDGERGFLYVTANAVLLHKDASVNSPTVGGAPRGARIVFTNTQQKNGARWYFLSPPGGAPGWVPSSQVSCDRPAPLPPGKPLHLKDTGLGNAHPTASMVAGANG